MARFGSTFKSRSTRAGALWLGLILTITPILFSVYRTSFSDKTIQTDSITESVFYLGIGKSQKIIINLNTADVNDLQLLKGIGSVIAQRIIDYRHTITCFQNKEQLKDVKGIGNKKYKQIEKLIITPNCNN